LRRYNYFTAGVFAGTARDGDAPAEDTAARSKVQRSSGRRPLATAHTHRSATFQSRAFASVDRHGTAATTARPTGHCDFTPGKSRSVATAQPERAAGISRAAPE